MLSYGRVTLAEAARLLGCHRTALTRLCATLGIDAPRARAAYLRSVDLKLDGVGRRPMTKHQLSLRGERALSERVSERVSGNCGIIPQLAK